MNKEIKDCICTLSWSYIPVGLKGKGEGVTNLRKEKKQWPNLYAHTSLAIDNQWGRGLYFAGSEDGDAVK